MTPTEAEQALRRGVRTDRERRLLDIFLTALRDVHAPCVAREQQLAIAAAQAGADYATRTLNQRGLLLSPGKPVKVKTMTRDATGRVYTVVEETVIAHERRPTTDAVDPLTALWQK